MQNIINSLAKINFELVEYFEGDLQELPKFEINDDYNIPKLEENLKKANNFYPYIIFDLANYKYEYILQYLDLIDKFYENRDTKHSNRLNFESIFDNYNSTSKVILKPISADCLAIEDKETKNKTLELFKKEFKDFGLFLNSQKLK
jgi:hypothetical protein